MLLNDKVPFRMQWPQYADLQINGMLLLFFYKKLKAMLLICLSMYQNCDCRFCDCTYLFMYQNYSCQFCDYSSIIFLSM